jgi:hypothetical protein
MDTSKSKCLFCNEGGKHRMIIESISFDEVACNDHWQSLFKVFGKRKMGGRFFLFDPKGVSRGDPIPEFNMEMDRPKRMMNLIMSNHPMLLEIGRVSHKQPLMCSFAMAQGNRRTKKITELCRIDLPIGLLIQEILEVFPELRLTLHRDDSGDSPAKRKKQTLDKNRAKN